MKSLPLMRISTGGFQSSSDNEDTENVRVTCATTKGKGKQTTNGNVSTIPLDEVSFHIEKGAGVWKYVVKRNIVDEKELSESTKECLDLRDLLPEARLEKIVLHLGSFYP